MPPGASSAGAAQPSACPTVAPALAASASSARPTLVLQDGHTQPLRALELSHDGRVLVTGGFDGVVRVWDTQSGLLVRRVPTGSMTFGLSLSDDGQTLATYAPDGETLAVDVHDLASAAPARSFRPTGHVFSLSPDGRWLGIGLDGVTLHDVRSGQQRAEAKLPGLAQALAFDATGGRLAVAMASATDSELAVLEIPSLQIVRRWKNPGFQSFGDTPGAIGLAGDQVIVLTVAGALQLSPVSGKSAPSTLPGPYAAMTVAHGNLWVAERETGSVARLGLPAGAAVGAATPSSPPAALVGVSSDGSTLATAGVGPLGAPVVVLRETVSGRTIRTIEGSPVALSAVAAPPSGEQLATGSRVGALARWSAQSGALIGMVPFEPATVVSLSYDDRGQAILVGLESGPLRKIDAQTGATLERIPFSSRLAFASFVPATPDVLTVTSDGEVSRHAASGASLLGKIELRVQRAQLSTDGAWLALVGEPTHVQPPSPAASVQPAAKAAKGAPAKAAGAQGAAAKAAAAAAAAAAHRLDAEVVLIEIRTGRVRWQATIPQATPHARYVGFSPDGQAVLVSTAELTATSGGPTVFVPTLRSYDAASGALRETIHSRTVGPLASLGQSIAIGGRRPVLLAWPTLAERARPAMPDTEITAIAAVPAKGWLAFAGDGGGTTLVSEPAAAPVASMATSADGEYVTVTPDGSFAASLDGARRLAWTYASPPEAFSFEQFAVRMNRPDLVARSLGGETLAPPASWLRPPRLEVLGGPKPVVSDARVTFRAEARSERRVDRVRLYVNGRKTAERWLCAPAGAVDLEAELVPGHNRIAIVASDADGLSSNPRLIDVVSTASAPPPALWVVAVGVSRYPNLGPEQQLQFAADDARSIVAALGTQAGPSRPFATLHATTLLDEQVTAESVTRALTGLRAMAPRDLAVVFFAGHGARLEASKMVLLASRSSLKRKDIEATGIGWEQLQGALVGVKGRVLLLLDACHSGYVSNEVIAPNEQLAERLAADDRAGVFLLAAARGSQFSYEVPPSGAAARGLSAVASAWEGQTPGAMRPLGGGHGLFTSALLEALAGGGVDRDHSGELELGELVDYVTERVRAASNGRQTPWVVRREMFGDFAVAPVGK